MLIPVILSGGSGTRLWPTSRTNFPKQFHKILSEKTLFQETILRLPKNFSNPIIVCNMEHRFLVLEQLKEINVTPLKIFLEPFGKNTAPAATIASIFVKQNFNEAKLLVLPADHLIEDANNFQKTIQSSCELIPEDTILTFGITPTRPETGYGYIKTKKDNDSRILQVEKFTEKPDKDKAIAYINNNNYFWNSGIFLFNPSVFLNEIKTFEPGILKACKSALENLIEFSKFSMIDSKIFKNCPAQSIDYGVMEKTHHSSLTPLDCGWNDLGSWSSIANQKLANNLNSYNQNVILHDSENCYFNIKSKLAVGIGLEDLIVVDTGDAILISKNSQVDHIKEVVNRLNIESNPIVHLHRKVLRPWGFFKSIEIGKNYQVKEITIYPGSQISLQKHVHRSEHWVVISGKASIVNGDKCFDLLKNESTFIPAGVIHRLSNNTTNELKIIEVQTGSYFGEDDIIRLEDDYLRS